MKKIITVLLALALCLAVLAACGGQKAVAVEDQEMTLALSFGERTGVYSGETVDGLPSGQGSFTAANADGMNWTYTGNWSAGHMQGQGVCEFDGDYREEGTYDNDLLNGDGATYFNDVQRFVGIFVDNQPVNGELCTWGGQVYYTGQMAGGFRVESAEKRDERLADFQTTAVAFDYDGFLANPGDWQGKCVYLTGTLGDVWPHADTPAYEEFSLILNGVAERWVAVCYDLAQGETKQAANGQTITVYAIVLNPDQYAAATADGQKMPGLQAVALEVQ